MRTPDRPSFIAATLPPPQQWEGETIWRSDLKCYQFSDGVNWMFGVTASSDGYPSLPGLQVGGVTVFRTDCPPSYDGLSSPTQQMSTTAAISTTVTARLTPTGTFRKARISWVNNGASGTAKLNIAANCSNDVEGLVATQSSKQRDAQMTMGDVLLLVSPVPITSLNFSSDTSITAATHNLLVTFGA